MKIHLDEIDNRYEFPKPMEILHHRVFNNDKMLVLKADKDKEVLVCLELSDPSLKGEVIRYDFYQLENYYVER